MSAANLQSCSVRCLSGEMNRTPTLAAAGHRNEMQKEVRTEHDKNESEKNPGNNRGDFHSHIVT